MKPSILAPLLLAAVLVPARADDGPADTHRRVQVTGPDAAIARLHEEGWDVYGEDPFHGTAELVVSPADIAELAARGLAPVVLEVGRPLAEALAARHGIDAVPAGYRDLATLTQAMSDLATAYPSLCQVVDVTASLGVAPTIEGRHLLAMKISDNVAVDEDEPTALVVACHHAREITTPEAALDAAGYLLANATGTTRAYVEGNEIWIVPVVNPDGYVHVFLVDNLWRKNKRETCAGTSGDGVDLNRNYPKDWGPCGGSTGGCNETYRGPSTASEAETQTIMALNQREHFAVSIDYHSAGEDVLWGYYNSASCPQINPTLQAPVIETRNALMAALGFTQRGPSAGGEHYEWQYNVIGSHAYLLEINSSAQGFQPPYSQVAAIVTALRPGLHVMLDRAEGPQIRGHVTDAGGNPLVADISIQGIYLTGGELRQSSGPDGRYQWMLSPGRYQVRVGRIGYVAQTFIVDLGSAPAELDVTLAPSVAQAPRITIER